MTANESPSKRLPRRVTIGGLVLAGLAALYGWARPGLSEYLGVELPVLVAADPAAPPPTSSSQQSPAAAQAKNPSPENRSASPKASPPAVTPAAPQPIPQPAPQPAPPDATDTRLHGVLRDLGDEEYLSPAGLLYTRGSAEGHRLKHLERHTQDQPTRPGRHGVFMGGMTGALKAIDEAYTKAQAGGRGVQREEDQGRTIYTVDLRRKIGYIGGAEGNRRNKPTAFRVRLVVEGKRVITAYPM